MKLTDAELIALAALVQVEAVVMAGDNEQRRNEGYSPAWRSGTGLMPHATELEAELARRKKAPRISWWRRIFGMEAPQGTYNGH